MNILEKDLEDMIWYKIESGDFEDLQDKGLPMHENATFFRQYNFGSYGVSDIGSIRLEKKRKGKYVAYIDIYELKKEQISSLTLVQALRYAKGAIRLVEVWNNTHAKNNFLNYEINLHLIGKSINTDSSFCYLGDVCPTIKLYTWELDFDNGLFFREITHYAMPDDAIGKFPKINKIH